MTFTSLPAQKGQGLVEYALILVLVAVAVIAVLTLLGPRVGDIFSEITGILTGNVSSSEITPEPTEEAFGYPTSSAAYDAFCATYTGTDHFHVHHNSTTHRYIGLVNFAPSPPGFSLGPPVHCP